MLTVVSMKIQISRSNSSEMLTNDELPNSSELTVYAIRKMDLT